MPTFPPTWPEATAGLLHLAADALDHGATPAASLLAFDGDEPMAVVTLREFGPGEALPALIEVLALLLPLGSDRIAVSFPGRAWSLDDPIVPVSDEGDLRQPVLMVTCADGRCQPPRLETSLHAIHLDDDGWRWADTLHGEQPDSPVVAALGVLLGAEDAFDTIDEGDLRLAAQLGRVVLLGHLVALSDQAARRLERHTLAC